MKHLKMLAVLAAGAVTAMSCSKTEQGPAYIGPSTVKVDDGPSAWRLPPGGR